MSLDDLSLPELVDLMKEIAEQIEYRAMELECVHEGEHDEKERYKNVETGTVE